MGHTCTQSVRDSSVRILTPPIFSSGNTLPHIALSLTRSLTLAHSHCLPCRLVCIHMRILTFFTNTLT